MSWTPGEESLQRRGQPVTSHDLEERINMYISAMDKATSVNDEGMSAQLQRDIQHLVDLMEKVTSGQPVLDTDVPPPLVMTPIHDAVANPLGELSSRLSDYHKALYFAEEELSENRLEKIQTLQKGLQTIHSLQKRAQAGFPIKEDEIPPPVTIPDDSEFDIDAINTITTRLDQYMSALSFCEKSTGGEDRRRIPKLQSSIRKLNFLLTRAQVKRPVWRKDIPPEFDYFCQESPERKPKSENVAKLTLQARALQVRVSKCTKPELKEVKDSISEGLDKLILKWTESKVVSAEDSTNLTTFTAMLENLEKNSDSSTPSLNTSGAQPDVMSKDESGGVKPNSDLELIDVRIQEYKTAALKSKHEGNVNQAIKHLKVVKGLQPMKEALDKGETVDMTLVPPPPRDTTPVGDSPPSFISVADPSSQPSTNEMPPPPSAHAQVSPFNIKPATETAEDKLARKLTSFLEEEGEMKSFTSASSSSPSSLESDLSPVFKGNVVVEKMKASAEVEKDLMSELKESESFASGIDPSSKCQDASSSPNDGGAHGDDSAGGGNVTQSVQMAVENGGGDSTCLKEELDNKVPNSLHSEPGSGEDSFEESDVEKSLTVDSNTTEKSGFAEEKNEDDKTNDIINEVENNENNAELKETPAANVEATKGDNSNSSSPSKSASSFKNPLDAIGFLACQDVPLTQSGNQILESNVVQNANAVDGSPLRLQRESSEINGNGVTNNSNAECQEKNRLNKDPGISTASELSAVNENTASSPSLNLHRKEDVSPSQDSQTNFSSSESSTNLSLPYSVNNQINSQMDVSYEKSIKNEQLSSETNTQYTSGDISVASKSDVRSFYSLSGDSTNFEDPSDMQEFQDLMESMSIVEEASSLPIGSSQSAQDLDKTSSSQQPIDHHQLNTASLHCSTIPTPVSSGSDVLHQNMNHSSMTNTDSYTTTLDNHAASLLEKSKAPLLNAQPVSAANAVSDLRNDVHHQLSTELQPFNKHIESIPGTSSLQLSVQLTGLETLKYDLLLADGKTTQSAKKEAEQLKGQMEMIKEHLKRGGRKDWEEYKACLEKELQCLNDGVKDCGEKQEWDTYKYLNNKRMLNERELCYLKQHITEIKD